MTSAGPRERMVQSAALLLRERGVAGTGMREIAEHANAPRGSLQHYFPDGKDQVVIEAMAWVSDQVTASIARQLHTGGPITARTVVAEQFSRWHRILEATEFLAGCPVVATLTDAAANDAIRDAAARTFDDWSNALAGAFRAAGLPRGRAQRVALVVISSLEGAIALARAHRDLAPLDTVGRELELLIADLGG